jgi:triacylglycerol lipase
MVQLEKKELHTITWENIIPPYNRYVYFKDHELCPFRPNANMFNIINAWWLIEASTLVYSGEDFVRSNFQRAGLHEVKFFSGESTQCFVASNQHFAIVAFRGSELPKPGENSDFRGIFNDWMANFKFLPVEWDQGGKVHEGFKEALYEVWNDIANYLTNKLQNRKIWITGHSLGAALATLAADHCANVQGLYTFGSPSVGDIDFKNDFLANSYRFVNNNDIVTTVPPEDLYPHVGELRYIDPDGRIHDNLSRLERFSFDVQGRFKNIFSSFGQLKLGFSGVIPDPIKDHDPRVYAIHIWNNFVEEG